MGLFFGMLVKQFLWIMTLYVSRGLSDDVFFLQQNAEKKENITMELLPNSSGICIQGTGSVFECSGNTSSTKLRCDLSSCFQELLNDIANFLANVSAEEELETVCPEFMFALICARERMSKCNEEDIGASSNSSRFAKLLLTLESMLYEFCEEEDTSSTKLRCDLSSCFQELLNDIANFLANVSAEEELETVCPEALFSINCVREKLSECTGEEIEVSSNSSKHALLKFNFESIIYNFCLEENNVTKESSSYKSSRLVEVRFFSARFLKVLYNSINRLQRETVRSFNFGTWKPKPNFNPSFPIFIVIHGYVPGTGDWQWRLEAALQYKHNCSVFIVDWELGASTFYTRAIANMKYTGKKVGEFIINLKKRFPTSLGAVHIIGYSLGAHAAGYAGKQVRKELNILVDRITGLDPAGPYFRRLSSDRRLDKTDARLVDVIHTNGADNILEGFGIKQPLEHINFYPDGGEVQKGCEHSSNVFSKFKDVIKDIVYKNLFEAMRKITVSLTKKEVTKLIEGLSCSHSRSTELFISSIRNCKFESVTCDSWEHFSNCKNQSSKIKMGFYADKNLTSSEIFYLKTYEFHPYCEDAM